MCGVGGKHRRVIHPQCRKRVILKRSPRSWRLGLPEPRLGSLPRGVCGREGTRWSVAKPPETWLQEGGACFTVPELNASRCLLTAELSWWCMSWLNRCSNKCPQEAGLLLVGSVGDHLLSTSRLVCASPSKCSKFSAHKCIKVITV